MCFCIYSVLYFCITRSLYLFHVGFRPGEQPAGAPFFLVLPTLSPSPIAVPPSFPEIRQQRLHNLCAVTASLVAEHPHQWGLPRLHYHEWPRTARLPIRPRGQRPHLVECLRASKSCTSPRIVRSGLRSWTSSAVCLMSARVRQSVIFNLYRAEVIRSPLRALTAVAQELVGINQHIVVFARNRGEPFNRFSRFYLSQTGSSAWRMLAEEYPVLFQVLLALAWGFLREHRNRFVPAFAAQDRRHRSDSPERPNRATILRFLHFWQAEHPDYVVVVFHPPF